MSTTPGNVIEAEFEDGVLRRMRRLSLRSGESVGLVAVRRQTPPERGIQGDFSPDGESLVWGSNRANRKRRETNLFIAKWE